jgi:hypothetical protein
VDFEKSSTNQQASEISFETVGAFLSEHETGNFPNDLCTVYERYSRNSAYVSLDLID